MILIGNKHVPYNKICKISSIDDINNTPSNSVVYFKFDIDILKYCFKNDINNAINVSDITEAIYCNSLECDYIVVSKEISKDIQKIAQNYMFDSKILEIINNDDDISQVAINEIDGCIYKDVL